MMVNTFLGMEIARRDASVFGAAHAERPQSYTEKTDCALQRRGNHCFRAGKPGKLTEKVSGELSRKVSEWKEPGFTRPAPNCMLQAATRRWGSKPCCARPASNCMLRAAARRWGQGLWHSPCTELHITGGGSATGARLVALALHRTTYYRRRLGDGSKAFRIFAAARQREQALWRSPCTQIALALHRNSYFPKGESA